MRQIYTVAAHNREQQAALANFLPNAKDAFVGDTPLVGGELKSDKDLLGLGAVVGDDALRKGIVRSDGATLSIAITL